MRTTISPVTTLSSLCVSFVLLALGGCDDPGTAPSDLELDLDDDDADARPDAAADLTHGSATPAFPGFGVEVSVVGDDVVLDWSATGPAGTAVRVLRSTDADALSDLAALPGTGVEEIVLPAGTTSFVDAGAADHGQATPTTFYRVEVDAAPSTMLMKISTAMAPGYNKLGLCMLDGPTHASDVAARLGTSVTAVWSWDAVGQSYVGWSPAQGVGTAADYALPFGSVVAAQVDGSTPAFQSLVGVVPSDEAFTVSGQPGYNWSVLPALYDGPTSASYWVDTVGYWGMGLWNNLTQSDTWYWGAGYADLDIEPCRPFYTYLSDDACTSNADCSGDTFCDFVDAAACGDVAAGLCRARPIGCELAPQAEVCGCDGTTYASACDAELAGAAVADADAGCPVTTPAIVYDAELDFNPGVPQQDQLVFTDGVCSSGFDLITPAEARTREDELCAMLGPWYIVRLANGGSMSGPGYGCQVFDQDARGLGASLCTTDDGNGDNGWYYLYDATGAGAYTELSVGTDAWGATRWRDPACPEAVLWTEPATPDVVLSHPSGCGGWTTLAWEAPSNGVADIHIEAAENQLCIGSGVDLEIRDDAGTLLWSQYDTAMGVLYEYADVTPVVAGQRLYLRVAQGPGATWCDSTELDFVVSFTPAA